MSPGSRGPPAPGNVAWQRGRLVFADASLATLRVAGTVPIDASEAVFEVLPRIAPIRVERGLRQRGVEGALSAGERALGL